MHHDDDSVTPIVGWVHRLAAPLTDRMSRRRVPQWCRRQGLQLLRWRVAKLFEGPSTWTAHQDRYRIQVLDEEGYRRGGYLVFRSWWSPAQRAQILWDEPSGTPVSGANGTASTRARRLK
jgi:hypothetical protein